MTLTLAPEYRNHLSILRDSGSESLDNIGISVCDVNALAAWSTISDLLCIASLGDELISVPVEQVELIAVLLDFGWNVIFHHFFHDSDGFIDPFYSSFSLALQVDLGYKRR